MSVRFDPVSRVGSQDSISRILRFEEAHIKVKPISYIWTSLGGGPITIAVDSTASRFMGLVGRSNS